MNRVIFIASLLGSVSFQSISYEGFLGEGAINKVEKSVPLRNKKLAQINDNPFIDIDKDETSLIDIRAYGDSGWSWTHESPAMAADFGGALDTFSPSGEAYRGDIFIKWATEAL